MSDYRRRFRVSVKRQIGFLRLALYREQMAARGVGIHRLAEVYGIGGIAFGKGTTVDAHAVIAATDLTGEDYFDSEPRGSIQLGMGCSILRGSIIASYGGAIELGNDVSTNPYCVIYGHGGLAIGSRTRIAAHTVIVPANHIFSDPSSPIMTQGLTRQGITIGDDVWIGAGVRLLDGIRVGTGSVVGAGSVVTRDVTPFSVVAGVPARQLGTRGAS